jgi:hypothetical protein
MKLFLFTTDLKLAQLAQTAGVDSVIVDWEQRGKLSRQAGKKLEINMDTPEDVKRLSCHLTIPVTTRINPLGEETAQEVDCAIKNGTKIIMLPMAQTIDEVKRFLDIVKGRVKTIVQIETPGMVAAVKKLKSLPWDYAHVGLNDLMVARGSSSIWEAVGDGTVEKICQALAGKVYGFGGMTILSGGRPLQFELILHEMTRLNCSLGILRRSFKAEILDRNLNQEIKTLRNFIECSSHRGPVAKRFDYDQLMMAIKKEFGTPSVPRS